MIEPILFLTDLASVIIVTGRTAVILHPASLTSQTSPTLPSVCLGAHARGSAENDSSPTYSVYTPNTKSAAKKIAVVSPVKNPLANLIAILPLAGFAKIIMKCLNSIPAFPWRQTPLQSHATNRTAQRTHRLHPGPRASHTSIKSSASTSNQAKKPGVTPTTSRGQLVVSA